MCSCQKRLTAISLGRELDIYSRIANNPEMIPSTQFYIGIDAGFGSSKFAIVLKCVVDDNIFILETIELDKQEFNYCINRIYELMMQYDLTQDNTRLVSMLSSPSVVMAVKKILDELSDYLETISRRRSKRSETFTMICVSTNQLQLFREAKYACKPQRLNRFKCYSP